MIFHIDTYRGSAYDLHPLQFLFGDPVMHHPFHLFYFVIQNNTRVQLNKYFLCKNEYACSRERHNSV